MAIFDEVAVARQTVPSCFTYSHRSIPAVFSLAGIALTLMLVVRARPATAQAVKAKLHGTVTDNTGAVIPKATVIAIQVESGQSATAVSSKSGEYVLPNFPVGAYVVKVTAPGFKTYSRTGIVLQVSNDL